MKTTLISGIALAMLLGSGSGLAGDKHKGDHEGTPSAQFHHIMMGGMKHDMKMSGDTDRDFASMMIMHHQQAIDMADIEIKHGKNAELKAMAQRMRDQQKKEQDELRKHD